MKKHIVKKLVSWRLRNVLGTPQHLGAQNGTWNTFNSLWFPTGDAEAYMGAQQCPNVLGIQKHIETPSVHGSRTTLQIVPKFLYGFQYPNVLGIQKHTGSPQYMGVQNDTSNTAKISLWFPIYQCAGDSKAHRNSPVLVSPERNLNYF